MSNKATNIGIQIRKEGDEYVINGRKLYGNCLWNKDLSFFILMGCSDPENTNPWRRHSTVIVPCDSPGLTQVRNLTVLGVFRESSKNLLLCLTSDMTCQVTNGRAKVMESMCMRMSGYQLRT